MTMKEDDKIGKLHDEIAQQTAQGEKIDATISGLNAEISAQQNRQDQLYAGRKKLLDDFQALKEKPHENLEQILKTQDGMAATDKAIAQTQEELQATTGLYQDAFKERIGVDNTIKNLESKVERAENIEEFKGKINEQSETLTEAAIHVADHVAHVGVVPAMQQEMQAAVQAGTLAYTTMKINDEAKIAREQTFHQEQLAEVADLKAQIGSQMGAAKAEMEKVMGQELKEMSPNAQKEFHQNEYSNAFHQVNELIANQEQQRDAFFASNNASPIMWVEQQQNRAAMNQELHAQHYGLTRDLAADQATINIDLSNAEMSRNNQQRLERQNLPPGEITEQMNELSKVQQEQYQGDLYSETNKIHAQNSPQLYQSPPAIGAPGVAAPDPNQSGPGGGPPPPGM